MPKNKFEETYFKGWYKSAVGNFSKEDLELSRRWFFAWIEKLGEYIPLKKGNGKKILEIGCSIGAVSSLLVEKGFDVYASDISEYAVKKAKKLTPNVKFSVIDIQKKITLPVKFDYIIAFEVVEHLENPEKGIQNIYEALEAKGKAVISTPYPYKWNFRDPTHINVKYPQAWVAIMKKVGFKNVQYHRFTLIPFFTDTTRGFRS